MSRGISIKNCREIHAARGRANQTWRGKKLPSKRLIRIIVSNAIIEEILKEERLGKIQPLMTSLRQAVTMNYRNNRTGG